jgi:hypothetical protein
VYTTWLSVFRSAYAYRVWVEKLHEAELNSLPSSFSFKKNGRTKIVQFQIYNKDNDSRTKDKNTWQKECFKTEFNMCHIQNEAILLFHIITNFHLEVNKFHAATLGWSVGPQKSDLCGIEWSLELVVTEDIHSSVRSLLVKYNHVLSLRYLLQLTIFFQTKF